MPGRLSLTIRGRCLLAAGVAAALCAVLVNERDLLRVAAFAIVAPLLASVVVGHTQLRLRARRAIVPPRVPAGDHCQVHLTLHCAGRLTGRLLLEDVVPEALGGNRRVVVTRMTQHRPVELSYSLHPTQRQVHTLGPLLARVTDPLGLAEVTRTLTGRSRLVVTPVVAPLSGLPPASGLGADAAVGTVRGLSPGQDSVVVRTYRHGDDLRKVHWRTSARRDELMVRVEEWPDRGGATVLLDHRAAAHRGSGVGSSLEYAVSLTASVYVHLRQCGQRVRLATADGGMLAGGASGNEYGVDTALDALAALRPTAQDDLVGDPALVSGREVVAVLGAVGPATVEHLLAHRPRGVRSHAVLLDVAAWTRQAGTRQALRPGGPDPVQVAELLAAAGWSVAIAHPDQPPSAVWAQLCLSSRTKLPAPR
jgi:uncharacterized protein (DUF58 family)